MFGRPNFLPLVHIFLHPQFYSIEIDSHIVLDICTLHIYTFLFHIGNRKMSERKNCCLFTFNTLPTQSKKIWNFQIFKVCSPKVYFSKVYFFKVYFSKVYPNCVSSKLCVFFYARTCCHLFICCVVASSWEGTVVRRKVNTNFESDKTRFQKHCFANHFCKRTPFHKTSLHTDDL